MMVLAELKKGETAKVISIDNDKKIKERLNNIGLTEGVKVSLVRKAPFGDPIEIKVRDFYLALRVTDAVKIQVKKYE